MPTEKLCEICDKRHFCDETGEICVSFFPIKCIDCKSSSNWIYSSVDTGGKLSFTCNVCGKRIVWQKSERATPRKVEKIVHELEELYDILECEPWSF